VNQVALAINIGTHLGVPPAGPVPEVYACVDKILNLNDCHEVVSSSRIVNQIPMHHACGVGVMESRIVFIPEKGRGVKGETKDYWQKSSTG
jgi:hypothetical protein